MAVRHDVDSIKAGARQLNLRRRRIDARGVARVEDTHANDDAALGYEKRDAVLVETRHMHIGVARETELAATIIDLGPAVSADPEVVA